MLRFERASSRAMPGESWRGPIGFCGFVTGRLSLAQRFLGRGLDFIGEGYVSGGFKAGYVGAVLVLDAEERPNSSAGDLREANEEGHNAAVLKVGRVN